MKDQLTDSKRCVLIVDDSRVVTHMLQRMLRKDFEVVVANNGQEALNIIEANEAVSLVISDLWMPVIDGFALLSCIKQSPNPRIKSIPVIIVTSKQVDSPVVDKLERLGVAEVLKKPVTEEYLRTTIERVSSDARYGKGALHLLKTQEANLFPVLEAREFQDQVIAWSQRVQNESCVYCLAVFRVNEENFTGQKSTSNIVSRVHGVLSEGIRESDCFLRYGELEFVFLLAGKDRNAMKKRAQYLLKSIVRKLDENQKLFNKFHTQMSVTMLTQKESEEYDIWQALADTQKSLDDIKVQTRNTLLFSHEEGAYILKPSKRKRYR